MPSDLPASNTGGAQDISLDDKSGLDNAKSTPPSASVKTAPTPPAPEPEPEPAAASQTDPAKALIDAGFANDAPGGKEAIINVSTAVKSLSNTSGMVEKAESQSTDMQTGAQVAHDNAVQSFVKRFKALMETIGEDAAMEVKDTLAKFHEVEQVVENALKTAGIIPRD